MLKKIFAALVVVSVTAGCVQAPSQSYRPANYSASPWTITGEYNSFNRNVTIKINNKTIVQDTLNLFGGNGEFHSVYEGKPISTSCSTSTGFFSSTVNCMVFVSGDRAATLTFSF